MFVDVHIHIWLSAAAKKWSITVMVVIVNKSTTVPMMTLSCIHVAAATVMQASLTFLGPSKDASSSTALAGMNLPPDFITSNTWKWNDHHSCSISSISCILNLKLRSLLLEYCPSHKYSRFTEI
ncbi:unnamed protein product [Sphenostylis stenocarpa]|uniref:Uncharacterized protein n=1 Tax=Sphenostylis stenocarpa TaxID=92480 RepID=A0AA86VY52_9FABA|nr:unnamed protein product [Sphenostylis stenocarpa]